MAEIRTYEDDNKKLSQFAWRSTAKQNRYQNATLIGNWNEDRFRIEQQKPAQSLPSVYAHYYNTIYKHYYKIKADYKVTERLRYLHNRDLHTGCHPCRQSKKDHADYKHWETTQQAAFIHPKLLTEPLEDVTGGAQNGRGD